MKVLLTQEVEGLGQAGQIKEVAEGYARNFLLPRKLAVPATSGAVKEQQQRQAAEDKRQAKIDEELRGVAQKLSQARVTIQSKAGEEGKLYGSVTTNDVAEAIEKQLGQTVDKRKIEIEEPIRHTGEYKVPVKFSKNVAASITVVVEALEEK
jgi:large subunit ribosomal protein L9